MIHSDRRSWMLLRWLMGTFAALVLCAGARAQQSGNVARIVIWQPKPGLARDFEEGYKRHLRWHHEKNDNFRWYGWNIIAGDRPDYFADGTFFHQWSDFDDPVSPAEDGANNALNVEPYADVRALATFEMIPALSKLDATELAAPLLTFYYLSVAPGRNSEFEKTVSDALRDSRADAVEHAVFRAVNGTMDYLLLLTAQKISDLGSQSAIAAKLLESLREKTKASPIVERVRTETGRYRPDLSYVPGQVAK